MKNNMFIKNDIVMITLKTALNHIFTTNIMFIVKLPYIIQNNGSLWCKTFLCDKFLQIWSFFPFKITRGLFLYIFTYPFATSKNNNLQTLYFFSRYVWFI